MPSYLLTLYWDSVQGPQTCRLHRLLWQSGQRLLVSPVQVIEDVLPERQKIIRERQADCIDRHLNFQQADRL